MSKVSAASKGTILVLALAFIGACPHARETLLLAPRLLALDGQGSALVSDGDALAMLSVPNEIFHSWLQARF